MLKDIPFLQPALDIGIITMSDLMEKDILKA